LGLTHANGAHFRATRQHADDWPQATARVLAETALGSGHTGPFVDALVDAHREQVAAMGPDDALLVLPAEIQRHAATRLEGAPDDADWWRRFGVSAGVLLAATSALAPLTTLQDAPQIKRPSRLSALAAALSRPNTALLVALIGLIIIGLAPLAGAGVRLGLLNLRHPDIESEMRAVEHARDRLAMYDALKKQSWSMAKLLADIVSCAPQGIELEWVRITHSDQSFTISGQAIPHGGLSATELINRMQEQLNDSQLFGEVDVNWDVKGEAFGFYEFDLTAKVERPHRPQRIEPGGELDWANWPLVDRKAGKGPTLAVEDEPEDVDIPTTEPTPPEDTMAMDVPRDEAEPEPAPEQDGQDPPGEPRRRSHLDRGPWSGESREGVASRDDVEDREGGKIDPATVPEPLTQAQVDRMTREEAQQHLTEISKARDRAQRAGDKELDTRLSDDFKLVLNRLKELKQQ